MQLAVMQICQRMQFPLVNANVSSSYANAKLKNMSNSYDSMSAPITANCCKTFIMDIYNEGGWSEA